MEYQIDNDANFLRSLNPTQRAWFLQREREHGNHLQTCLRALAQAMSEVSALNGATLALLLGAKA